MNFSDLLSKMKAIDEGAIAECGDMPLMGAMGAQEGQQDNVSISINMNGQGAGGIKDLMAVLRDIENGPAGQGADDTLLGDPDQGEEEPVMGAIIDDMEGEMDEEAFGNAAPGASGQHTAGIAAVTPTGDDMFSKGGIKRPKVNGGENPMQEAIAARLAKMYNEMRGSPGLEEAGEYAGFQDTLPGMEDTDSFVNGNRPNFEQEWTDDFDAAQDHWLHGLKKHGLHITDVDTDAFPVIIAKNGDEYVSWFDLENSVGFTRLHTQESMGLNESADILKLSKMLNG